LSLPENSNRSPKRFREHKKKKKKTHPEGGIRVQDNWFTRPYLAYRRTSSKRELLTGRGRKGDYEKNISNANRGARNTLRG